MAQEGARLINKWRWHRSMWDAGVRRHAHEIKFTGAACACGPRHSRARKPQ